MLNSHQWHARSLVPPSVRPAPAVRAWPRLSTELTEREPFRRGVVTRPRRAAPRRGRDPSSTPPPLTVLLVVDGVRHAVSTQFNRTFVRPLFVSIDFT